MTTINDEFVLPSGLKLKNRFLKGAMTENLSDEYGRATKELERLYRRWANESGVGILLSGNIQVDRRFMERERNVCIDLDFGEQTEEQLERLRKMAAAGKENGSRFIAQIAHAGRQATMKVAKKVLAPSAISTTPGNNKMAEAVEATEKDIERIIEKFVYAAKICKEVGFDGVELHGAHGYLLSSFLNPLANQRTDSYGGSVENRASLLIKTVKAIRAETGDDFTIGVKLNSADFQKGGFTVEEAAEVALLLAKERLDFLELSGGTYENAAVITGNVVDGFKDEDHKPESTKKREAYFVDFALFISKVLKEKHASLPIAVTGGFRSVEMMNSALQSGGIDLIGVGRPLGVDPKCTQLLLDGKATVLPRPESSWKLPDGKTDFTLLQSAAQETVALNLYDIGHNTFEGMSDTKYPNLMEALARRRTMEEKLSKTLKGYPKEDDYIHDFLKGTVQEDQDI